MHEGILRDFFIGRSTATDLARDLRGSIIRTGNHVVVDVTRMTGEFTVEPAHLIRVCEAVLAGHIAPELLAAIGFALQTSDVFSWDGSTCEGERIAETTADWSAPEINFPLTMQNIAAWKTYLATGRREALAT